MIPQIQQHRSVRHYSSEPVPDEILDRVLAAAARASTVGNMQLYSIVVTTDKDLLSRLAPLHFTQPAAVSAPAILTFCADIRRFSQWCRQREAEPCYDNFCWFMNAATDALLASENAALEAEAQGLGICYLGTTLYNASEISDLLDIPWGVVPVTSLSVGYPQHLPPLTDRLPLEAVVHRQKYRDYSPEDIDRLWAAREASDETAELLKENGLDNLAKIFTERRYVAADNVLFSEKYLDELRKKGFFNR